MACGFVGGLGRLPSHQSPPLSRSHRACPSAPHHRTASAARTSAPTRMVATSDKDTAATSTVLSSKAAELLGYLRAHKSIFSPGVGFKATHLALYRKNDTGKSLVPADELVTNAAMLPGVEVARLMLELRENALERAKESVLRVAPAIADDSTLQSILWFDLAYFFRVASYGIGVASLDFMHEDNMKMLRAFYNEIAMPPAAVSTGINALKEAVLAQVSNEKLKQTCSDCFAAISSRLES